MHKSLICFLLIAALACTGCRQQNKQEKNDLLPTDTSRFFPVMDLIAEDIKDVQQTPYFIYKITTRDGKRDSSAVSKEQFLALANPFLAKDINTPVLRPLYKETVFHDLSTKSITITYTALNETTDLHDINILLNDETNKLKNVFMRYIVKRDNDMIIEQWNWKAGKSFRINRLIKHKDGVSSEENNFINWNDPTQ